MSTSSTFYMIASIGSDLQVQIWVMILAGAIAVGVFTKFVKEM